jgi:hypothetical protein
MDREKRDSLIAQYADGFRVVSAALEEITDAELDACEAPGEWSPRQVIHHLGDSEMTSAIRLRRMLVEDIPLVQGYDQDAFAARLHYDRPIHASLAAFGAARDSTVEILLRMTDADWQRKATHSDSGTYSAHDWLAIYAVHAHEHADQILRARVGAQS